MTSADTVLCNYCGRDSERVTGATMYPHRPDLARRLFYRCVPCGAWVGTHEKTGKPLGRLANDELRRAKQAAHAAFDPMWSHGRRGLSLDGTCMNRAQAYRWLARELGVVEVHIGQQDVEGCKRIIAICEAARKERAT